MQVFEQSCNVPMKSSVLQMLVNEGVEAGKCSYNGAGLILGHGAGDRERRRIGLESEQSKKVLTRLMENPQKSLNLQS